MMRNNMRIYLLALLVSSSLFAQEKEEIPIEEIRDNKIKSLLEIVKENRDIYVSEDKIRLDKFIKLVSEREKLLQDAKNQLAAEQRRNKRLEETFEANEKTLAELEDSLQIKVGVLGELFGVTRQFAGELLASSEQQGGNLDKNMIYKQKYLIYKHKYIILKNKSLKNNMD